MKGMILAAGFGTRLKPLTDTHPKALIPYRNTPMINYQVERLINIGVDEIIVNAYHHSERIARYFKFNRFNAKIKVIREEEILGTGGAILNAKEYLKDEDYFYVLNVDIDTDMNLRAMKEFHKEKDTIATLAVQRRISQRKLEFNSSMNLAGRATENSDEKNLFAFNGIHIISNAIFDMDYKVEHIDIIDLYLDLVEKGKIVRGYDMGKKYFKDLGKIENLLT
jgi:MurNAc alpha-1-phosphate uridylyltransferase